MKTYEEARSAYEAHKTPENYVAMAQQAIEEDKVLVETMPDYLRATHRNAGNWGVYPHNGAVRRFVDREEAEEIVISDSDGYDHIVRKEG